MLEKLRIVYLKIIFLLLPSKPSHCFFRNRDKKISIPVKSLFKVAIMPSDQ